jgi:hypothetical protein
MKEKTKISKDRFEESPDVSSGSGARPFSGIFQEIVTHLTEIIRSEIRLARAEIRQDVVQVSRAGVFLLTGALFGMYAFGFVLLAAVYALGNTMPAWASALIVGAGLGLIGALCLWLGRKKLKLASLRPDKTIQSLQENVTWLKKQTK